MTEDQGFGSGSDSRPGGQPPRYGPPSYGANPYSTGSYGGSAGQSPYGPGMLASGVDRDRVVDVLKAAYGEGRLDKDEFDARCARAMAARRYGDLGPIVADLPGGSAFAPPAPLSPYVQSPFPANPYASAPAPTSGLATGSMICGILEVFTLGLTSIPAVILGHMARSEIRSTGKRGDGMAITGLVLGYIAIGLWALAIIALIVAATRGSSGT